MNEDKKCGTCLYFNGEVGDGIQFCDEKEINVSEHRWCIRYKEKMICDGLERKNEHDGE